MHINISSSDGPGRVSEIRVLWSPEINAINGLNTNWTMLFFIFDDFSKFSKKWRKALFNLHSTSIGLNQNTTNFKLCQTRQIELQTHSNPGLSTKTNLRKAKPKSGKTKLPTFTNQPSPYFLKSLQAGSLNLAWAVMVGRLIILLLV